MQSVWNSKQTKKQKKTHEQNYEGLQKQYYSATECC